MTELKPCPFCGAIPQLYWEPWKEISEMAGTFILEADHHEDCFIRNMNGLNITGRMSSGNKERIINAWNRRADNAKSV